MTINNISQVNSDRAVTALITLQIYSSWSGPANRLLAEFNDLANRVASVSPLRSAVSSNKSQAGPRVSRGRALSLINYLHGLAINQTMAELNVFTIVRPIRADRAACCCGRCFLGNCDPPEEDMADSGDDLLFLGDFAGCEEVA